MRCRCQRVVLRLQQKARNDFEMQVSEQVEIVEITARPRLLKTEDATLGPSDRVEAGGRAAAQRPGISPARHADNRASRSASAGSVWTGPGLRFPVRWSRSLPTGSATSSGTSRWMAWLRRNTDGIDPPRHRPGGEDRCPTRLVRRGRTSRGTRRSPCWWCNRRGAMYVYGAGNTQDYRRPAWRPLSGSAHTPDAGPDPLSSHLPLPVCVVVGNGRNHLTTSRPDSRCRSGQPNARVVETGGIWLLR